jgi:nitrate reductase gamma subunit
VWRRLAGWLLPWRALRDRERAPYSAASIVFHIAVILVPLFFVGHVVIWRAELGIALPALSHRVADVLSLSAVAALAWLLSARALHSSRRRMSGAQDWLLPAGLLVCFGAGLLTSHPHLSPFDARVAYLLHLLSAETLLVFVPLSKLQHMTLFWTTQMSTELGWRFTPGAGANVRASLGKQGQGI